MFYLAFCIVSKFVLLLESFYIVSTLESKQNIPCINSYVETTNLETNTNRRWTMNS